MYNSESLGIHCEERWTCGHVTPESAILLKRYRRVHTSCATQYLHEHRMRSLRTFALGNQAFYRGEKVSRTRRSCSALEWLVVVRGDNLKKIDLLLVKLQLPRCVWIVAWKLAWRRSVCSLQHFGSKHGRVTSDTDRRAPDVSDEWPKRVCTWEETQAHSPHCFFFFKTTTSCQWQSIMSPYFKPNLEEIPERFECIQLFFNFLRMIVLACVVFVGRDRTMNGRHSFAAALCLTFSILLLCLEDLLPSGEVGVVQRLDPLPGLIIDCRASRLGSWSECNCLWRSDNMIKATIDIVLVANK